MPASFFGGCQRLGVKNFSATEGMQTDPRIALSRLQSTGEISDHGIKDQHARRCAAQPRIAEPFDKALFQ
ncbi:hypothetical protein RHI9324_00874 [Rhizobium sp. CECT 9324]|nr:hypothetical protein RHI9324_00874 [Rhizobium sp. CECT 9324]